MRADISCENITPLSYKTPLLYSNAYVVHYFDCRKTLLAPACYPILNTKLSFDYGKNPNMQCSRYFSSSVV